MRVRVRVRVNVKEIFVMRRSRIYGVSIGVLDGKEGDKTECTCIIEDEEYITLQSDMGDLR